MTKDEALKMAIEAMTSPNNLSFLMAITACKEALEQPSWQGLSDDERYLNEGRSPEEIEYARAIEQALKEKNT